MDIKYDSERSQVDYLGELRHGKNFESMHLFSYLRCQTNHLETTAARETGVQMILQIQREVLVEKWAEPLFCVVPAKTKLSRANKGRRQQRQTAALIKPPIKLCLQLHQQLVDETYIFWKIIFCVSFGCRIC